MMAAEVAPGAGHGLHHLPLSTPVLIEVLGYIPGLRYFSTFYKFIIHTADPRAAKYPLMEEPDTTAGVVLSYLLFCLWLGPKFMRRRETPRMTQGLLCFYNFIIIYLNGFLALNLTHRVFSQPQISVLCKPVEGKEDPDAAWVMTLLYIFHLSKVVELADTIFLVWKKKDGQLSFLHIYHHSTIVAATWIGVKFAPGGTTAVICMINSWVHVLMYVYYQLTAVRVNLSENFKKLLTLVQMGQFCYTLAVCASGLWIFPCGYPEWILWWLFLYMLSFLILFSNFFYRTYTTKNKKTSVPVYGLQVPGTTSSKRVPSPNPSPITDNSLHNDNSASTTVSRIKEPLPTFGHFKPSSKGFSNGVPVVRRSGRERNNGEVISRLQGPTYNIYYYSKT